MPKPIPYPEILARIFRSASTPSYVYFERTIRQRVDQLTAALDAVPGRVLYAMKANGHPRLLKFLKERGVGIDAVSPGELLMALRVGFPVEDVLFSANNMTDAEMHFAHRQGVLLNIGELSRLNAYGKAYPGSDVCVRLNPQIGAGHHDYVITAGALSKFGVPVRFIEEVRLLLERHSLNLVGLHQHIGSGIPDTETLWQAVSVMLDTAKDFEGLSFVNIGGGLGVPYRDVDVPLDLDVFAARFGGAMRSFHDANGAEMWIEPGRFLVAEAGVLLVTATTVKDNGDRRFVGVDSGMGHLVRPAMYDAFHEILNLSNPGGTPRTYDVVGNICETGDCFARDREIPEVREGDCLAILDVGAYGRTMASTYNLRPIPAEVWVPEADPTRFRVITERKSAAHLVADLLREASF